MSRWGEAFAALSRPSDTMDTVDTVEAATPPPAIVSHSVHSVTGRMGGDRESEPSPVRQPPVVHPAANDPWPVEVDAAGPVAPCPTCGSGAWWRTSAFPTGATPGPWTCFVCSPTPGSVWQDACAVPPVVG